MVFKTPLKWPAGTPRSEARKDALFGKRSSGGFSYNALTVPQALDRLAAELRRLGVRDMDAGTIIMTAMKPAFSGTTIPDQPQPKDPGVIVHWEIDGKERTMAIDIYKRTADNIAAVAAVLEYLRGVERHGGKAVQEQAFAGFDALPAPLSCWAILGMKPVTDLTKDSETRNAIIAAHREKVREASADPLNGGERMATVNAARDEALKSIGER